MCICVLDWLIGCLIGCLISCLIGCVCVQVKLGKLAQFKHNSEDDAYAGCVTVEDVRFAIACTMPPNAETAREFCWFMSNLANAVRSSGCDIIAAAGGAHVLVQLLAARLDDDEVVFSACGALYNLAKKGSTNLKAAIRSMPDVVSLLEAASARLRGQQQADFAADAMMWLGV